MHNSSEEDFDGFLQQQLNNVEVDNALAEKYLNDMKFPVILECDKMGNKRRRKIILFILMLLFCFVFSVLYRHNFSSKNIGNNTKNTILKKDVIIENSNSKIKDQNKQFVKDKTADKNNSLIFRVEPSTVINKAAKSLTEPQNRLLRNKNITLKNHNQKSKSSDQNIILVDVDLQTNNTSNSTIKNISIVKNSQLLADSSAKQIKIKPITQIQKDSVYIIW